MALLITRWPSWRWRVRRAKKSSINQQLPGAAGRFLARGKTLEEWPEKLFKNAYWDSVPTASW
jgi:hypothetical protein